ncbi:hypothetical protein PGT21_012572 [Puccinia graminis f. sp. tritici]|uniref:Uncharacterized protein n=1 Tax=Puccinia graminis f. sp. tritici TaxID=56615 RepID=A0A5B0LNQ7_PUCGR|nr:hypothetical protein PGT21_012572 [Puccinia graminis f. sp. tritici]
MEDDITANLTEAALLGPIAVVPLHGQAHSNSQLMGSHATHCSNIDANREVGAGDAGTLQAE